MISKNLIKDPTVKLWRHEIEAMISGEKNMDLNKLGGAGAYVKKIFSNTNDVVLQDSIKFFFYVINEQLEQLLKSTFVETDALTIIIDIVNSFKRKDTYQYWEERLISAGIEDTASVRYFIEVTALIYKFLEQTNDSNLHDHQSIIYNYLLYVKKRQFFLIDDHSIPEITKYQVKSILESSVDYDNRIAALAAFLLYSIDEETEILSQSNSIKEKIVEYCIASKNITNDLLNKVILDFARFNKPSFSRMLELFNCNLSLDGFNIVYADQSFKNLEPAKEDWENLDKVYHFSNVPVLEILKEQITKKLVA